MATRRQILKTLAVGGGGVLFVPSVFSQALESAGRGKVVAAHEAPILVVLQLSGGNDWLNTVVPLGNDDYLRARPKLGMKAPACLKLNDDTGLHGAFEGVKEIFDRGELAIVHGVGYPNANRSHFRSMEIWHTASDANKYESYGWLGRYFDRYCGDLGGSVGVAIGSQAPQAFAAARPTGLAFQEPNQLRMRGESASGAVDGEMEMEGHGEGNDAGASIAALSGGGGGGGAGSPLDFIEHTAQEAHSGAAKVDEILGKVPAAGGYPNSGIARDCALVGRLIAGEMPTRVFYLAQGGYDTHTQQAGAQERLLRELGGALRAFVNDLRAQGNLGRVQILVFSEFGRRVKENANGGTDHGAAAPVLVVGGGVSGGIVGAFPELAAEKLVRGDLAHRVDFRSVYATLLERHLGVAAGPVLGREFPLVDGLGASAAAAG